MIAIISIGSNLGNRQEYLQLAVDQIAAISETLITKTSSIYETLPQLMLDQPNFFNAIIEVESELTPLDLLAELKKIELAAKRERGIPNGPRTLDTDIIYCSELPVDTTELQLPHPRAHQRQFVLLPWLEIDPDAILGDLGSVADLSAKLGDQGVVKIMGLRLV